MMSQSKYKILVVEDEFALRNALRFKLKFEGFTVLSVKNGAEGLEVALRDRPDLILLDIVMPVMDGVSMLRELRKNEWGKTVPVIILTNLFDASQNTDLVEFMPTDYLIKSDWKLQAVIEKIHERLDKRE